MEDPPVSVVILGHSFVDRLRTALEDFGANNNEEVQEALNLKNDRIRPFIHGQSGANIDHLKSYAEDATAQFPHIALIDIGQNDLCYTKNGTPRQLAEKLTAEIKRMFTEYERLEVAIFCKVIHKTKMWKGDKKLTRLNRDIDEFNYQMMKLTRNDIRILRWRHRGMYNPRKSHTRDGTHPNSSTGFWKYVKSISACCRWAKSKLLERRNHGKKEVQRRANRMKREKIQAKLEKRDRKRQQAK